MPSASGVKMKIEKNVVVSLAYQVKTEEGVVVDGGEAGREGDGGERGAALEGAAADRGKAARASDRDERGAVEERLVRQVRHAFGKHRVPVGDDDLPAAHVQSLGGTGRRRGAARRRLWR